MGNLQSMPLQKAKAGNDMENAHPFTQNNREEIISTQGPS